jgi:hypothetical protein
MDSKDIDTIIGVVEGDCSNTKALIEVLELKGVKSIPFSYPSSRDYSALSREINKLSEHFGVSYGDILAVKTELDSIRKKLIIGG